MNASLFFMRFPGKSLAFRDRGLIITLPIASRVICVMIVTLMLQTDYSIAADIYTFEDLLPNNSLSDQDGWRDHPGDGEAVVILDTNENGTIVVRHYKTNMTDQIAFLSRTNDATFSFVPFSGSETNAIIQFDATGEYTALFALGRDVNGDGLLSSGDGELGPVFGVYERQLRIQEACSGTTYDDGFNEGGGDGNSGNEWYRIQLRINFTANSGDGSASLYFKNLSDGNTFYETATGVRNKPLGLGCLASEASPAFWSSIWIALLSNGNSVPSVDNLIPNLNGIMMSRITALENQIEVSWRGGTGPYQLKISDDLISSVWSNIGDQTVLATTTVTVVTNTGFMHVIQP